MLMGSLTPIIVRSKNTVMNAQNNEAECSVAEFFKPISQASDISLLQYVHSVYGKYDGASFSPQTIYLRSNVEVVLPQISSNPALPANSFTYSTSSDQYIPLLQNNQWTEVTRVDSKCISPQNKDELGSQNQTGCLFQLAAGSGIYVNIGRHLRASNSSHVRRLLQICQNTIGIEEASKGSKCTHSTQLCAKILSNGYDSLLIESPPNLLICSGECGHNIITNSCVPIETKTGYNASLRCTCDNKQPILNCGNPISTIESCEYKKPLKSLGYRPKTCFLLPNKSRIKLKSFNLTVAFTSDVHGELNQLPKLVSVVNQLRRKHPLLVVDSGDIAFGSIFAKQFGVSKVLEAMSYARYDAIALGHGGIHIDKVIARNTRGYIDAILGGHSHVLSSCNNQWHTSDVIVHTGYESEYMDHNNCRKDTCITGAIIISAISQYFNCTSFVLFESGSIRGNFNTTISEADLFKILPWENKMVKLQINGAQILDLLHYSIKLKNSGAFLQTYSIQFHPLNNNNNNNNNNDNNNIHNKNDDICMKQNHIPLDNIISHEVYHIVVTDWLASGGDGYGPYLKDAVELDRATISNRDIVHDYIVHYGHLFTSEMFPQHVTSTSTSKTYGVENITSIHGVDNKKYPFPGTTIIPNYDSDTKPKTKPGVSAMMHGLIGLISDATALMVSYPLLTIVAQRQGLPATKVSTNSLFSFSACTLMFFTRSFTSAVFWSLYHTMKELTTSSETSTSGSAFYSGIQGFFSSTIAGLFVTILTNPLWVAITRLQLYGEYPENVYLLCDGLTINMILVIYPSLRQLIFETVSYFARIFFKDKNGLKAALANGIVGLISTLISTVTTYPLQSLRTRQQAGSQKINRSESYWKGLPMKLISCLVHDFIFFFMYNILQSILEERKNITKS
eukprot:gene2011-3909_t